MECVGCAGQQDAHVGGPLLTVERFASLSGAGVGVGAPWWRRRRREGGGIDGGGGGGGGGSGGGAPTLLLLLALRIALLARRRRFRREVDVLAAETGAVRVSIPVELESAEPRRDAAVALGVAALLAAAAFTAVTILSRAARASVSRRSKAATDRAACPVSV